MPDYSDQLFIAESFLDEMLEAEKNNDYEAWIVRFEAVDLQGFSKEIYAKDIYEMNEKMGAYKHRMFLATLRAKKGDDDSESYKFAWKGVYEKEDVIMIVGIHKKDNVWYVHQYTIHY